MSIGSRWRALKARQQYKREHKKSQYSPAELLSVILASAAVAISVLTFVLNAEVSDQHNDLSAKAECIAWATFVYGHQSVSATQLDRVGTLMSASTADVGLKLSIPEICGSAEAIRSGISKDPETQRYIRTHPAQR